MSRNRDLLKNTVIIFIGTICTKFLSFLLLPLYTSVLSASEYGIIDLLTTLISLISPMISLQISQGLFRNLVECRNDKEKQKRLISTSIVFLIINSIIYLLIFFLVSHFIANNYKWFLVIIAIVSVFSDLLLQIARGIGKNDSYSIAGVITAIFTILFNILFLIFLHFKVNGMLLGTLIGYIVGILYLYLKLDLFKLVDFRCFNKKDFKILMKYSLPLVPNALSWWIFNTSDRVIVSIFLGLSFTGILSVSYKFSSIIILLYNIFDKSWCESIILHIKDDDIATYFNKTFIVIFNLFFSIGICLLAFMPILFKMLVNSNYMASYNLIPIVLIASIFQVIVGLVSVVYAANDDTKSLANTAIWSSVVNLVIHLALIKYIGVYAAAVSTLCSYLFFSIYRALDVSKKYIPIKFNINYYVRALMFLIIIIVCYYCNLIIIKIFGMIIAMIYSFASNKKEINSIKKIIINKIKKRKDDLYE